MFCLSLVLLLCVCVTCVTATVTLSQALARVTGPETGFTLILTLSVFCSLGSGDLVAHG